MTQQSSPYLAHSRGGMNGAALPAPTLVNGEPHRADGPCTRPSCHAVKRHMVDLAQQVEALTLERDALRTALDEVAIVDWTALGGEDAVADLTARERGITQELLLAGRDEYGDYRTVPSGRILRRVWGAEYDGEQHLLRVTLSRLRQKLRAMRGDDAPHGWDVVCAFAFGYRLAPHDPTRRRQNTPITDAERARMRALRAEGLPIRAVAFAVHREVGTVRKVLREGDEHG